MIALSNPYFLLSQQKVENKNEPFYDPSKRFSVSVYALRVSSAELMDNILSNEIFFRDLSTELNGGFGFGGEVTFNPRLYNLDLIFYLSSEYVKIKDDELVAVEVINDTTIFRARYIEEISMIPLEAGLLWNLPVGTDRFKIYIGGGGGIYFGERKRTIAGISTERVSTKPGFSLNILSGVEYFVGRNLSLDFKFKFREGSFESEDKFTQNVPIFNRTINSRIIADGVRLSAGIRYNF